MTTGRTAPTPDVRQPDEAAPERAGYMWGRRRSAAASSLGRTQGQPDEAGPDRGGEWEGRRLEAAPASSIVQLCAFRVGDEEYVIDLRRIREILQPLPITPVPRAPDSFEGVMHLRGEVIPVVDVRKRLGLVGVRSRPKVLVVNVAGRVLGLMVDAVSEVVRIPRSAIGPPPLLGAAGPRLFLGVCGSREVSSSSARSAAARPAPQRLRFLLNVKALLESASPAVAEAARRPLVAEGDTRKVAAERDRSESRSSGT